MFEKLIFDDKTFYNEYQLESIKKIQLSLIVILMGILLVVLLFTESNLQFTYFIITLAAIFAVLISIYYRRKGKKFKAVFVLIALTVIITWLP